MVLKSPPVHHLSLHIIEIFPGWFPQYQFCFSKKKIIIIIIISHHQHGSPWPSLATRLYRPSLPVCFQGYIPYGHRAVLYKFKLVVLTFARLCEGVHKSISLMSSSLLLQQSPACLVRLTWIVLGMGGR